MNPTQIDLSDDFIISLTRKERAAVTLLVEYMAKDETTAGFKAEELDQLPAVISAASSFSGSPRDISNMILLHRYLKNINTKKSNAIKYNCKTDIIIYSDKLGSENQYQLQMLVIRGLYYVKSKKEYPAGFQENQFCELLRGPARYDMVDVAKDAKAFNTWLLNNQNIELKINLPDWSKDED